jgi:hypothetical protein
MKLWQVIFETDGPTVKAPGVSSTEIKRETSLYLADSAEIVWDAIAERRADPEFSFVSLAQAAPMVTVLKRKKP